MINSLLNQLFIISKDKFFILIIENDFKSADLFSKILF